MSRIIINNRTRLDDHEAAALVESWLADTPEPTGAILFQNGYGVTVRHNAKSRTFDVLKQYPPNVLKSEQ